MSAVNFQCFSSYERSCWRAQKAHCRRNLQKNFGCLYSSVRFCTWVATPYPLHCVSTTCTSQSPLDDASMVTDSRMWIFQCVLVEFGLFIRLLQWDWYWDWKVNELKCIPDSVPIRCQPEFIQVFFLQNSFVLYFELEKINLKFWQRQGLNPESSAHFTNCLSHYTTHGHLWLWGPLNSS